MKKESNDIMIHEFNQLNEWLFNQWQAVQDKSNITLPYLITPSTEYCLAKIKILVLNWETNGWGEKEFKDCIESITWQELAQLYNKKINID